MARFRRSVWNELHGLTPQEIEIIKRFESDSRGTLFVAAADILRKRGYIDEAIVVMEDGVRIFPQYHTARASLGRDYFLKGMMNEARNHLTVVVQKSADNPMAQRLKLKIDIVFDKKSDALERLDAMKRILPDDDFTKAVRDLLAVDDWDGCRTLMRAELERLGIQWNMSIEKESMDAALDRLQASGIQSTASAWEIPQDTTSGNTHQSVFAPMTSKSDVPQIDESQLPGALRTGTTLAFVRGDAERYLALKGFRRVQAEGLFSASQVEVTRKHSLDGETLAEIYATQGFFAKAVGIYERLIRNHPDTASYKTRLVELHESLKNQAAQKVATAAESRGAVSEKAGRMSESQEKKLQLLERILQKLDSNSSTRNTHP